MWENVEPSKWYIKITEDNIENIRSWRSKMGFVYQPYVNDAVCNNGYVISSNHDQLLSNGYYEIDTFTFDKLTGSFPFNLEVDIEKDDYNYLIPIINEITSW